MNLALLLQKKFNYIKFLRGLFVGLFGFFFVAKILNKNSNKYVNYYHGKQQFISDLYRFMLVLIFIHYKGSLES